MAEIEICLAFLPFRTEHGASAFASNANGLPER